MRMKGKVLGSPDGASQSWAKNSEPDKALQREHWSKWNLEHRATGLTDYMQEQLDVARTVLRNGRTLDVGCGTGWLGALAMKGPVVGVDFSEPAIMVARQTYPQHEFIAGDFETVEIGGQFDNVVSADCIAHVPNQQGFIDKIGLLLKPGGIFLLFTQNPFVWNRYSGLKPPTGQIRNWPPLDRLRDMMDKRFKIEQVNGIAQGGDLGILWLAHKDFVRFPVRMLLGREQRDALYDRYTGRDMVIIAKRK